MDREGRERRAHGTLPCSVTNYYCDSEFMNDLLRRMPVLQADALVSGTERAMRTANQLGVTTIYEGHLMAFSLIESYRRVSRKPRPVHGCPKDHS